MTWRTCSLNLQSHQISIYTESENYFNSYKTFLQNQYKIAIDYFIIMRIRFEVLAKRGWSQPKALAFWLEDHPREPALLTSVMLSWWDDQVFRKKKNNSLYSFFGGLKWIRQRSLNTYDVQTEREVIQSSCINQDVNPDHRLGGCYHLI